MMNTSLTSSDRSCGIIYTDGGGYSDLQTDVCGQKKAYTEVGKPRGS